MSDYSDMRQLELDAPGDVQAAAQVRLYGALRKGGGTVVTAILAGVLDLEQSTVTRQSIGDIPVPLQTVAGLAVLDGIHACRVLAPLLRWMVGKCPDELLELVRDVGDDLGQDMIPAPRPTTDEQLGEILSACVENAGDQVQRIIRILRDRVVSPAERSELCGALPLWIQALQAALVLVQAPALPNISTLPRAEASHG